MRNRSIGHRRGDRYALVIGRASQRTSRCPHGSSAPVRCSHCRSRPTSYLVEGALLLLGAAVIVGCARAALLIGFARRLRDTDEPQRLRYGAMAAARASCLRCRCRLGRRRRTGLAAVRGDPGHDLIHADRIGAQTRADTLRA